MPSSAVSIALRLKIVCFAPIPRSPRNRRVRPGPCHRAHPALRARVRTAMARVHTHRTDTASRATTEIPRHTRKVRHRVKHMVKPRASSDRRVAASVAEASDPRTAQPTVLLPKNSPRRFKKIHSILFSRRPFLVAPSCLISCHHFLTPFLDIGDILNR